MREDEVFQQAVEKRQKVKETKLPPISEWLALLTSPMIQEPELQTMSDSEEILRLSQEIKEN